jgi:hypothetical protein
LNRNKRKMRRAAFWRFLNCQCANCGESRSILIDFHHVGEKRNKISTLLMRVCDNPTHERCAALENELLQVIPLCCACHRLVHAGIVKLDEEDKKATINVVGKLEGVLCQN